MPPTLPPLDRLDRAVKRRALTPADVDALRAAIGALRAAAPHHPSVTQSIRGLASIDTQLSRLAGRLGDARLEPASFNALPAPVKRGVLARLDAAGARIARETADVPTDRDADSDLAFRCASQHKRCCDRTSASRLWCHLALAVCLVRTLLPLMRPASVPGQPHS
jgi:hypothetical protein